MSHSAVTCHVNVASTQADSKLEKGPTRGARTLAAICTQRVPAVPA